MLYPTLRRLQVFVKVAETGSFAAAARQLGISQPSVSSHIQHLEKELAGPLFVREPGCRPMLNDGGRKLLVHARSVLASASRLEEGVSERKQRGVQTLSIVCQRSLANTVMRETLARFACEHRDIRTAVRIAFQEEVIANIRSGAADVGYLLSNTPIPGTRSRLIGRVRFVVFAPPGHPLARRKKIPPAELGEFEFVGPPDRSMFGRTVAAMLQSIGVERINIVSEGTEFSVVRDLTVAGIGLCCSLEASVSADVASRKVAVLDIDAPPLFADVLELTPARNGGERPLRLFSELLNTVAANWR
jgi:LysR family transcriptional regulator, low CO2-responsive transcriptional regulator